jgi:hypothetical protein
MILADDQGILSYAQQLINAIAGIHGSPDVNRNYDILSKAGLANNESGGIPGGKSYVRPM